MKRWGTLAIILALLSVGAPAALAELPPGGTFIDDDGSVHEPDIEAIFADGITNGCSTGRFCPNDPVTRAQMARFLVRALDLAPAATSPFSDSGGPFLDDINRLAAAGITDGCGSGRFCPDDLITRAQMARFLVRGLHLPAAATSPFSDSGGDFQDDINRLASAGITNGCAPGLYCPHGPVTRGQMASFLTRALGLTPIVPPERGLPPAGNPGGNAPIPAAAAAVDTSQPNIVIGTGTPAGCTSAAVVAAVAQGGIITFDCGPSPVTIEMTVTAKVVNDKGPEIVIDGGGLVTLSGMGQRRILYMNTCDQAQVWTTSHCNDQDHPRLTVQNLTFVNGNMGGIDLVSGGGAIFVRGGRFKVVNSRFFDNRCTPTGPDVGGAAIRVFDQFQDLPVYVVNSTFGTVGHGNICSNGGAISSIGVSWTILNSWFVANDAVGVGANPAKSGTPGGGNGGAIALDGNRFTLILDGTRIESNHANEGGGAVFFVSNNRTGNLVIRNSVLVGNPSDQFETSGFPGIFYLGSGPIQVTNSVIAKQSAFADCASLASSFDASCPFRFQSPHF